MDIQFCYKFFGDGGHLYSVNADINGSYDFYKALKNILKIYKLKDYSLVRLGSKDCDGGYVMADNFTQNGVAYSFGISSDVSWDNDVADLGYKVYMYDNTIDNLPYNRDEFYFFKEGISGYEKPDSSMRKLSHFITKNGHECKKNMILKMDVEGAEWSFIETVEPKILSQFDQIIIEFHALIQSGNADKKIKALEKLNDTHRLIHLHGNNTSYTVKIEDTIFPNVIEATYVNKETYNTEYDDELVLPNTLDRPNDFYIEDIILDKWNAPLK